MTGNRIALVSAISFAVLALFLFSGAKAATPTVNNPFQDPPSSTDPRVDGDTPMLFGIDYADVDGDFPDPLTVTFDGVSVSVDLVCSHAACGTDPDGFWRIDDGDEPLAETLVTNVGDGEISYRFTASTAGDDDICYPSCDTFEASGTVVNTLPVLAENAAVGDGMPEDDYTLTITYTDADNHAGTVTAEVCDTTPTCESLTLSTTDTDFTAGAVYSVVFNTELGGTLDVTVSATDGYPIIDDETADRTTTFTVDTTTPWFKNGASSVTSAGEDDPITFTVVYCVFDATDAGTPVVNVAIESASHSMTAGDPNLDACKNGVDYSTVPAVTVDWAATAQAVVFSGSNDNAAAAAHSGLDITINDAPTLSVSSATEVADDFVLAVHAEDKNSDNGDTFSVFAIIEFHASQIAMSCDGGGDCTVTVAEATIIDDMGGPRAVTFRAEDSHTDSTGYDGGDTIDVTKTSSFTLAGPGDQTPEPGLTTDEYTFTIVNNGNFADTFTISASSLNAWVDASSDPSVTVAHASSGDFTIIMDVPHVASGTTDSWSVDVTAGNDGAQVDDDSGTTTVAVVLGHTVTIADDTGNAGRGDTATYHFTITNTGNADASFDYVTNGTPSTGSTALGMGESETVSASHTVPSDAAAGATFTLTFTSGSESASATTTVIQDYGVSISQTGGSEPSTINPGDSFTIEYTVTNTGNGADSVSVSFNAAWLSGSGTSLNLAGGATGTATATLTVPADAASGSSSSISASATGAGSSGSSGSYSMSVNSAARSVSLAGDQAYTINQGSTGSGTVTVTNGGVGATFAVTSAASSLSFETSEMTLAAGADGEMTFTIHAVASGDLSFTVADTIDGSSDTFTVTLTAREFSTDISAYDTDDCGSTGVVCTSDPDGGWDGTEYKNSGTWSTTMTVTDDNGQSGTRTFSTTIPNAAPSVSLFSADSGTAGDSQTFTFDVPSDSDGTVTHFVVDFGDGNSKTFEGSVLTGTTVTATHTYESAGDFSITATAYDNSGGSNMQAVEISVGERTVTMDGSSYTYNLVALLGFFILGMLLAGTAFKMQQGEIAGDEEMNERDRQRLESVERRMESLAEREELLEVSAYDASRAATKLEEHISAFNEVLVRAQEIAAEEKLQELEAAEAAREKEEEQMQLDLEDPDIEMVAERFHDSLSRLVKARDELSKIEEQLAHILKMERDEQLEKLTSMTESYETTKRKIDALQSTKEARDASADESSIMNMLSAAASGAGAADFGDFGDLGDADEFEVEIYEDEDGSFYYIDPDTGEEVPCDEDGNAL